MPVLTLPDAEIHYTVTGSGPALLFLSGTAWPGWPWELHQVPEFARDHTTIVYDQRGTGNSTARSTDFSTTRLAADAAALLDHLGIDHAILCGHSNGGRVAQMVALEHPHKVAKLILVSAGGTHHTSGIPLKMAVNLAEKGYAAHLRSSSIAAGSSKRYYIANRAKVEAFVELLVATRTPLETMLRHVIARQASDTTSRIGEIRVPTLVLAGDDETHGDAGTTHLQFAHILAERIPNATLVILPGEGHFYAFYEPEKTNALIREFLKTGS